MQKNNLNYLVYKKIYFKPLKFYSLGKHILSFFRTVKRFGIFSNFCDFKANYFPVGTKDFFSYRLSHNFNKGKEKKRRGKQ